MIVTPIAAFLANALNNGGPLDGVFSLFVYLGAVVLIPGDGCLAISMILMKREIEDKSASKVVLYKNPETN